MTNIPTTEQFIKDYWDDPNGIALNLWKEALSKCPIADYDNVLDLMIKFAKAHVKAALETALEEVPYGSSTDTVSYEDVKGILDCYPEENIK